MNVDPSILQIINVVPTLLAVTDKNLHYLAASQQWLSFFQLPQAPDLVNQSLHALSPALAEACHQHCLQALQGTDGHLQEVRLEFTDRKERIVNGEVKHWRDQEGLIGGLIIQLEDVTELLHIQQNEKRFQLFMNNLPGLCWITNSNNELQYANKYYFEKLHLSPDVVGKAHEEIFGEALAQRSRISDNDILKSGENKVYYQTLRDEQGHPQYFKTYKFPIIDADKENLIGAISFDITKTKQLEEDLYQSEAQFNQAFEHSLLGMAIINRHGNLERVNKSFADMIGYLPHELIGRSISSFTHPEDQEMSNNYLSRLKDGKVENVKVEKRYLHKNGSVVWAVVAATMLTDRLGKPVHFVSQIEDITQRRAIEDNLSLSEKKYRTLFENVQDVFYQTNTEGLITDISPSIEIHSGYKREEVLNHPVIDFYYYPQDRERIVKILTEKGNVIDFEARLKTKLNEIRYASVNARLLIENGEVVGAEGSLRDVTTRKFQELELLALNNELTASNEQKNKLLSIIGHDLRNPISGSLQLIDLTLMDLDSYPTEDLRMYLTQIRLELSNAFNLLEDLLAWAKAQFNSLSFMPVEVSDIGWQIEKAVATLQPMADKKRIQLSAQVASGLQLQADLGMLDAVLRNLITNAIKFTREGGRVDIKVTELGSEIRFAVSDNGLGMSAETLEKLFDVNHHLSTYGTAGEKGSGLGLSICREFVWKHQGKIGAESEPNVGSTFYFTLPKEQDAPLDYP